MVGGGLLVDGWRLCVCALLRVSEKERISVSAWPLPLPPINTRSGGCDNCTAAAAGGGVQRDLAPEARLLLATVLRLREMGVGTAVQLLRGSRCAVLGGVSCMRVSIMCVFATVVG